MEVKKYIPFAVMNHPKPKIKLEAKGLRRSMDGVLSLENKKKLDIFLLVALLRLVGNSLELSVKPLHGWDFADVSP